jgi:membrane protein YdbS with pleckstrin-like domain
MEDSLVRYPGQPRDEITQRVVFKHFLSVAPIMLGMTIVLAAAIAAEIYLSLNANSVNFIVPSYMVSIVGFLILLMIFVLIVGTIWIWRRNRVIITNNHIVDVEQLGLFNRVVATLRLEEIQDVSASVNGPTQMMFKFGTVIIQTAGERENFVFDYVPNPYELEQYILELRKKNTINKLI